MGFFSKIAQGLKKTKDSLAQVFENVFSSSEINDEFYDELEEALIIADVGVATTSKIIQRLRDKVKQGKLKMTDQAREVLRDIVSDIMAPQSSFLADTCSPCIILIIGVNGVGKTTTIGKLAHNYVSSGKSVLIAAGDTFRAAASEQLSVWGERANVPVIKHGEGADPAAVVFDAIGSAKARKSDILICDTAGRLHNKKNLMEELKKIGRVIDREYPQASREVLLVLDSTTGQNGIAQAKAFGENTHLTGIVLTKLDGTAKGGIAIAVKEELNIPVRFIGVGEGIDDLQPFDSKAFAAELF